MRTSVLVPAHRVTYLEETLASVLAQTHQPDEVIVGDDSDSWEIAALCRALDPSGARIHHHRNERRGVYWNHLWLYENSTGDFVKFVNDDDRIRPRMLERMVAVLQRRPDVTVVTSYRRIIDSHGGLRPDLGLTRRPWLHDVVVPGPEVIAALMSAAINFVGEPTTAMFRRADLDRAGGLVPRVDGLVIPSNLDVYLWWRLLESGSLAYLVEPLSEYRVHAGQLQHRPDVLDAGVRAWQLMAELAGHEVGSGVTEWPQGQRLDDRPWWPSGVARLLGSPDVRMDDLMSVIVASGGDAAAVTEVARRLWEVGNHADAAQLWASLANRQDRYPPALEHLAHAYAAVGDQAAAQQHAEAVRALRLGGDGVVVTSGIAPDRSAG